MRLRYTRRAQRHLDAIAEYIADRNPDASWRVGIVVYRIELADPEGVIVLGV